MIGALIAALQITAFTIFDWEPQEIRFSCYLPTGNKTCTGATPFEGGCAVNQEHLGQVAMLFDSEYRFIGFFEVNDVGGHHLLREGKAVDVFRNTMEGAREFIRQNGDHGFVIWVDAEG